jgi:hypothetical protein
VCKAIIPDHFEVQFYLKTSRQMSFPDGSG